MSRKQIIILVVFLVLLAAVLIAVFMIRNTFGQIANPALTSDALFNLTLTAISAGG